MARGNQRDKAREANLKKQASMVRGVPNNSPLSTLTVIMGLADTVL